MNNNKIVSSKTTSAIFLAIVLVTGTIAISSSSSFMINAAHAQSSYYGNNNGYELQYQPSYKPDYNEPQYQSSYDGKDNYKSTKDSSSKSVDINKLKCINNNLNINGNNTGDVNIGNKEQGYLGAYLSGGSGNDGEGYYDNGYGNIKQSKGFDDCIINNNNTNTNVITRDDGGNEIIPTAALTVKKEIFGCDNIRPAEMNCEALQNNDPNWLLCTDPAISNSEFCQEISENFFDIEVLDDQNNQIAQFEGSAQGTTIQNLQPGTYIVNEINTGSGIDQLEREPEVTQECIGAGFTDGGLLTTQGTEGDILYTICFEYEDEQDNDCSTVALAAGEEKTCTVKNYLRIAD